MGWLAELYRAQGRYAEAEPLFIRALANPNENFACYPIRLFFIAHDISAMLAAW